jgi:hypothetical protein
MINDLGFVLTLNQSFLPVDLRLGLFLTEVALSVFLFPLSEFLDLGLLFRLIFSSFCSS